MSSALLTNTITVRGMAYEVSEINGRVMREVRKRLREQQTETVEAYLAFACTVEPKFASEAAAAAEPHMILKAIADEAYRLGKPADPDASEEGASKND